MADSRGDDSNHELVIFQVAQRDFLPSQVNLTIRRFVRDNRLGRDWLFELRHVEKMGRVRVWGFKV